MGRRQLSVNQWLPLASYRWILFWTSWEFTSRLPKHKICNWDTSDQAQGVLALQTFLLEHGGVNDQSNDVIREEFFPDLVEVITECFDRFSIDGQQSIPYFQRSGGGFLNKDVLFSHHNSDCVVDMINAAFERLKNNGRASLFWFSSKRNVVILVKNHSQCWRW